MTFDEPPIINLILNRYQDKKFYFMGYVTSMSADMKSSIESKSRTSRLCWNQIPKVKHETELWDYIFQVLDDFFDQYDCDTLYLYKITFICSYEFPGVKIYGSGEYNAPFKPRYDSGE